MIRVFCLRTRSRMKQADVFITQRRHAPRINPFTFIFICNRQPFVTFSQSYVKVVLHEEICQSNPAPVFLFASTEHFWILHCSDFYWYLRRWLKVGKDTDQRAGEHEVLKNQNSFGKIFPEQNIFISCEVMLVSSRYFMLLKVIYCNKFTPPAWQTVQERKSGVKHKQCHSSL